MTICAACHRSGWGTMPHQEAAFRWAGMAAQANFPPGMTELGYCYEEGIGTERHLEFALRLLEDAIAAGYGGAATNLALRFYVGEPYGKSFERARSYAEKGFLLGEPYAGYLLGTWWEEGSLCQQDLRSARAWFEVAASQGSRSACTRLSMAHLAGELGLSIDLRKSGEYLELASRGASV
jgi:uncharacterized protein